MIFPVNDEGEEVMNGNDVEILGMWQIKSYSAHT